MNSFLLVCDVFFVVFGRILGQEKNVSRLSDLYSPANVIDISGIGTLLYLDEMNHKSGFFICHSDPKFEIGF